MNIELSKANSLKAIEELARQKGENDISLLPCANILVNIKKIETYLAAYKKAVREEGIDELDRVTEVDNFIITKGEMSRYDYTNNPSYVTLLKESEELSARIKKHEQFLKSLKESTEVLNPDSGELTVYRPPVRRSFDRITISERK